MNGPGEVRAIRCDSVFDRNSYRSEFGDITGLAESIRELGLLQPILVCETEDGYELLAGRRRLAAMRSLNQELIHAVLIPVASNAIIVQNDENAHRKPMTPMEKVNIARALMPILQKEALKRRAGGARTDGEKGSTRELVARRVDLSHETLKKALYICDHLDALRDRIARAMKAGQDANEWQALAEKLDTLVKRMNSSERANRLTISAAYKEARQLIEENRRQNAGPPPKEPMRIVRLVSQLPAQHGKAIPVQVSVNLSMDDPPKDLIVKALQAVLVTLAGSGA
jgi:ParB/RepB/Spo0J family partition protein